MADELAQSEKQRHLALEHIQEARRQKSSGDVAAAQTEMNKAWRALDEALTFCPLNHRARFLKVSCAMNIPDFATARSEAKKIYDSLTVDQMKEMNDSMLHLSLVHASKMIGETTEALRYAREAVQLYPADPQAYMVLGELCDSVGQISQAEYMCRQALMHNENTGCVHPLSEQNVFFTLCCLGSSLLRQGKHTEAEVFLVRAVKLHNSSPLAYKHLAEVYQRQGRIREALQVAEKAHERDPNDRSIMYRIQQLREQGGIDQVEDTLSSSPRGDPEDPIDRDKLYAPSIPRGPQGPYRGDGYPQPSPRPSEHPSDSPMAPRGAVEHSVAPVKKGKSKNQKREEDDSTDWFACCIDRSSGNCG